MKNQKGISSLLGIVVVIILGVLVIGGVLAYQYWWAPEEEAKLSETERAKESYFEVKELGVKFKLSEDIKDLTYIISAGNAYFSTKSLASKEEYCSSENGPLGLLEVRSAPPPSGIPKPFKYFKLDNDFYVYYWHPQEMCARTKGGQNLVEKQKTSFLKSLASLEILTQEDETADWKVYRNEEDGYEVKYPSNFVTSITNCHQYKVGEEVAMRDKRAVKIQNIKEGIFVLICSFPINYKEISKSDRADLILIDSHKALIDKFVIRGGGRAYYYIERNDNSSVFIDSFWEYPKDSYDDSALKPKERTVERIISTFRFIE